MEATMARKRSAMELEWQSQEVDSNTIKLLSRTMSSKDCPSPSADSFSSMLTSHTMNSSPMLMDHLGFTNPYHNIPKMSYTLPNSTLSFSIPSEAPHLGEEPFLSPNTHTQVLEQISALTGHGYSYGDFLVADHLDGSNDQSFFGHSPGSISSGIQCLDSHTFGWSPQFSVTTSQSDMNYLNGCIASDDSKEHGFHLTIPKKSNKRSISSDSDDEIYHCSKKSVSEWACLTTSESKCGKLKPKSKKISATDPQSIAARHRRERISERLKVLQELIPNGSKVDLVTMLEKAINYVKFLQLQVKVLTTDEYWPTQDGTLPNIDRVKEALQALTSTKTSVDTEGTSSTSSDVAKKDHTTKN